MVRKLKDTYIGAAIKALYGRNAVGCCLHITLDDGNIRDTDVDFCIMQAIDNDHKECENLARALRALNMHKRAYVLGMYWCPSCKDYTLYDVCGMDNCSTKSVEITNDRNDLLPHIF